MANMAYISHEVNKLVYKHHTRNPYELCDELGIRVCLRNLGADINAYYHYFARISTILLNERVPEHMRRTLVAHELGHDRLHREIAVLKGFQEADIFEMVQPTEYEANIFAAELLIEDEELMELLNDDSKSFFGVARELCVPADLLDFKFRVLKHKGYRIEAPYIASRGFLKEFDQI